MKQKLFLFAALILLIAALIGLNAASYVQKEKKPDSELDPVRSTYNYGSTGTRAFYELLKDSGRNVTRWQEPPSALLTASNKRPKVFVIVGTTRRDIPKEDADAILQWVSAGGRLVIIDRAPSADLLTSTANWKVSYVSSNEDVFIRGLDPTDQKQMTDKVEAGKPVQPTTIVNAVNAVQPSKLASSINFEGMEPVKISAVQTTNTFPTPKPTPASAPTAKNIYDEDEDAPPPPTPKPYPGNSSTGNGQGRWGTYVTPTPLPTPKPYANSNSGGTGMGRGTGSGSGSGIGSETPYPTPYITTAPAKTEAVETPAQNAPVVHIANNEKNLLADFPYGSGSIVFLSDPYIVSNSGIKIVDNLQLGINIVSTADGVIAFDEYHQGFGDDQSQLMAFFSGTPLFAILAQIAILVGAVFYSQSRRFARPLPVVEPDRLSKLEYVSAMAELQQSTKAYDLAIENVYTDFRRRAARLFGVDNNATPRKEMATLIAERIKMDTFEVYKVMQKAEDIIHGERTNKREVLEITGKIREFEEKLNMKRKRKEAFRK